MNFAGLFFLLTAHFLSGRGLLKLFRIETDTVPRLCLSFMLGVPIISLAPCLLQLLKLPIDGLPAICMVTVITLLFSIPLLINIKNTTLLKLKLPALYEWPYILVFAFLFFMAAWRSFYYPPYARDMLAGSELLAEFAVREKTMISSVFTIDLQTTNNYFKSPYITCLQILYKLLVSPFGQLWMVIVSIPFAIWLYNIARNFVHPTLAGLLMLVFMTMPEVYSYSYLMLYDYNNMVFFFGGFYFLYLYTRNKKHNYFAFAALVFGIATYIRTETLVLLILTAPLVLLISRKQDNDVKKTARDLVLFIGIPALFYFLCVNVFVALFIPIPFNLDGQINHHLQNVGVFFSRVQEINTRLIFSDRAMGLFGYFIMLFIAVLLSDLIYFRKFNTASKIALYGIAVVYFGLPLLGYLLPLVDLDNTTKRGMFKMLPLMLFYMANSGAISALSARINAWEALNLPTKTSPPAMAKTQPKQPGTRKVKNR